MAKRKPALPVPTEAEVLRDCLAYLKARKVFAWRCNTGDARLPGRGGKEQLVRFGTPGVSDILAVMPDGTGRLLAVECKRQGAKLRPAQMAFLDGVRAAGGVALVVTSVGQLAQGIEAEREV